MVVSALVLSALALAVALASFAVRLRDATARALRAELRRLDDDIDDLFDRMKRTQNRQARREVRARTGKTDLSARPGEDPEHWKARVRPLVQSGVRPQPNGGDSEP